MKRILYISFITLFFIAGCDERLDELNTDKRNPAEADPVTLFAQGLRETHDMMASISVNDNPFNLYAQFWAQTTYPDESQYNMVSRSIPHNFWINAYRDALADFKAARILIEAELADGTSAFPDEVLQNRIAAINIMEGYIYHTLVDAFGDVPYTEALDPDNINPAYDDAKTIYMSVLDNLKAAVANINTDAGGFPEAQDPMYHGDMEGWKKFANSLRLRMAMRLADVDPATSKTVANEAIASGVFESNADNADMEYLATSPNTNPIYEDLVLSGRHDFVAANTIIDVMQSLDDPRIAVYFDDNLGAGVYKGGIYGSANNFSANTQIGDILHTPELPGVLMTYAEVEFLKAEAAERGGYTAVEGTAAMHYNAGIEASFNQWGLSDALAQAYISQPLVNYGSAPGTWKQKIGLQLWLALYNQGFEAWNTWKRFDFVGLLAPPGMSLADVPLRLIYPLEEAQLNPLGYGAAAGKITGGDVATAPIFWDTEQPFQQ